MLVIYIELIELMLKKQANNPLVWEVLEPILKLASQFLINSHISHWYVSLVSRQVLRYRV